MRKFSFLSLLLTSSLLLSACSDQGEVRVIRHYPADNVDNIISKNRILLDDNSYDGAGSLSITVETPTTVRLYETGDIDAEDVMLIYQAAVKSRDLDGMAYLEMWCVFDDGREFFSRGLNAPWTGNIPWSIVETPFFLKKGQNPTNVRLNLVIDGSGTVWIDDIYLRTLPLPMH
ncbi:hypothetical protein KQI65_02460 [bacterium]|nr:hypothetical protein [bacterium]